MCPPAAAIATSCGFGRQVRRQLLGAMGDQTTDVYDGLPRNSPLYLFPTEEAHVPLKAWADARSNAGIDGRQREPASFIAGVTGFGASNSHHLNRRVTPTMFGVDTMHPEYNRPRAWHGLIEQQLAKITQLSAAGGGAVKPGGAVAPLDETPAQLKVRAAALELEVRRLAAENTRMGEELSVLSGEAKL